MTALAEDIQVTESKQIDTRPVRIVFAGGGTGGHLYPSLAVASAMRDVLPNARFHFLRPPTARSIKIFLTAAGETLQPQAVAPLTMKPWRWPGFWSAWRKSTKACAVDFKSDRPDLVVGSGAFASAPAICMAAKMGIPTALLNPDVIPGRANRMLAKRVDCVLAQFESTRDHLPDDVRVEVAGCPVRLGFGTSADDRKEICFAARSRRESPYAAGHRGIVGCPLDQRSDASSGLRLGGPWQLAGCSSDGAGRSREGPSHLCRPPRSGGLLGLHRGDGRIFMSIADLVVSRAGASTLAELRAVGVPAIFLAIPAPSRSASDRQRDGVGDAGCRSDL